MAATLLLFVLVLSYNCQPQFEVLALATSSDHDFSYMKSVYNATDLPLEEEYDYIVIGGGTAGCPLAATLSEKYSVLVLERGSAPLSYPQVLDANGLLANLLEEDNGNTPAQKFTSEDGVAFARGRVLGGTSMINAGFYSRADQDFYKESGIHWDMNMVHRAYQWVEDTVVFHSNLSVFQSIFRDSLLEAGVGPDNGFNLNHIVGTKTSGSIFDGQGKRHGAVEHLNRGVMKNLRVAVEAYVDKIIFSSNIASRLSATGVIYTDSKGKIHRAFIRDKGEVILSAGAIGSPQLLLLSGIGPNSYLSSLKIPVVHQNPDVGNFMADNPRNNIYIVVPFALDPSIAQVAGITGEKNIIEAISFYLQFSFPSPFGLFPNSTSPLNFSIVMISEKFSGPLSSGSLRLVSSSEVRVSPLVRFNYFAEAVDLARCVRGMRKVGDLLKTDSMEQLKFQNLEGIEGFKYLGPSLPKNYESDDASMETFCRTTITTFWHYHGGCVVGKVVDGDFRVIGANSLRVVDGSTFHTTPGTNPQATLMMIGRYIGLKILQERRAAK